LIVIDGAQRDANTGSGVNFLTVQANRLHQFSLHPLGDADRDAVISKPVEENRELVAAEAGDDVRVPNAVFQAAGRDHQKLVADSVTEAVVNVFEAIKVEEENREEVLGFSPGTVNRLT